MSVFLHEGDCFNVLKTMPSESVDSVVTDPPYGLSFMGRKWDYDVPTIAIWQETLRVLKPGGHLLSFSGTRTYHRMVVAIEDAGFEIRDQIGWLYGSGFPKSHNLDGEWDGWGTALKPAWEPIVLARKSFAGTVAANMLTHGTGAMNIGACRVVISDEDFQKTSRTGQYGETTPGDVGFTKTAMRTPVNREGRWPANVIHDGSDEVLEAFPAQSSVTGKRGERSRAADVEGTNWLATNHKSIEYTDTGSPSRFFYCAKTSKAERNGSKHPTIKPVSLMRYLCRLVTPPGGTILDPFAGTGSTGQAAVDEGFSAILIEQDPEYCTTIRCRLVLWLTPVPDPTEPTQQSPSLSSPDASQDSSQGISSPLHGNAR